MARLRTFIAVDVPDRVRRVAGTTIGKLRSTTDSIRWVPPHNVHITMKFLGDVEETDIYQVCRLTAAAAKGVAATQVTCRGIGAFPTLERPRTVWLGIDDPDDQLRQLHRLLEQQLSLLGFPFEQRRYQPHVTLGRTRYGRRDVDRLIEEMRHLQVDAGLVEVDELVIYSSERGADGPNYTVLGRAPLG